MPILSVSSYYRAAFGTAYGMGENFSERKDLTHKFSTAGFGSSVDFLAGGIAFDLITEEKHTMKNDVTTHPVEARSPITDHIRNQLREGKMTGMISNYSLFAGPGSNISTGAGFEDITGLSAHDRIQKAYEFLKELWKKQVPVDIVSVLEVYKSVAITSISIKRDASSGDAQYFEISFREILVKKLDLVESKVNIGIADMETDINRQSSPNTDVGRQIADDSDISEYSEFLD